MNAIARLAGVLLFCLATAARAVAPPSPGVATPAGFTEYFTRLNSGYRANLGGTATGSRGALLAGAAPSALRLPVLLAAYSDLPATVARTEFENRLFGAQQTGTMAEYYAEVSLGRFSLSGEVYGWFTLPGGLSAYTRGDALGDESLFPDSPGGLVAHAVLAADSQVDFGLYDNDGPDGVPNSGDDDGVVDGLIVVHSGGDAAAGDTDNIWSHTGRLGADSVVTSDPAAGGGFIRVDLYSILPELAGNGSSPVPGEIGVFCHEFGHQLGLVDLYPVGYNQGDDVTSNGIGIWGLMAFGTRGGTGSNPARPTHPCAWSKLRLGWVDIVHEDSSGPLSLAAVQASGQVVRVWDNDDRNLSCFLLAHRARTGFDSSLPGEGLLVWHIDGAAFDNDSAARKLVDLEEADGLAQLDSGLSLGDDGDPFPGAGGATAFTAATSPSSLRNDGSPSGVSLSSISLESGQAVFTLSQPGRTRLTISYDEHGPDPDRGFGYDNNLAHGAVVFTAPVSGVLEAVSTVFIYPDMSYELAVFGGHDRGLLNCPLTLQSGQAPATGWQAVELDDPVYLEAGDSVIVDLAWRASAFDHGWPLPFDPTGSPSGRSWVSLYGIGNYDRFEYDIALRALLRPVTDPGDALILSREMELLDTEVNFGRTFSGETYTASLPIANTGRRPLDLTAPSLTGEAFSLLSAPARLDCGVDDSLVFGFIAGQQGQFTGRIALAIAGEGEELEATLESEVAGWSLRYDSLDVPTGYAAFTDAAHGAVRFDMPGRALVAGIRTYCLRDSMTLSLKIWAGVGNGGGRCLVAQTAADTLLPVVGWHQLFLPVPVDVDSGDTFIADIRYATPGVAFSELIPIDTTRPVVSASYYNVRESENWIAARHPVAVRALLMPSDSYRGEVVLKRAQADLPEGELVLEDIRVNDPSTGGLWLVNRGTAVLTADLVLSPDGDSCAFTLSDSSVAVACGDSIRLEIGCTAYSPGVHTALLEINAGDTLLAVQVTALAGSFELGYDEGGHTATAGFKDTTAAAAVVLGAPWDGTLRLARFFISQSPSRVQAILFGALGEGATPVDSLASSADSLFTAAGWHELAISPEVAFEAGDSFVLAAVFTVQGEYPLPIDNRGEPSGLSLAAGSLAGPWEFLDFDLNLRAVLSSAAGRPYPVAASGDLDGNGRVDIFDLLSLLQVLGGKPDTSGAGDLDGNGRVDIFDLIEILRLLRNPSEG
ncbi:MAG: M6 family metalloprotease domain-containing protein [Candidatus Glassbacteria bacterium]|nr:M6 family metalloprotease domain-containing protein [Candidatus Glassbacteria bacterium]